MKKKSITKEIFGWVRYILVAVVFALILNNFLIANAVVISPSMEDTIMTDSRIIGSRIAYALGDPQRFDIILFIPPDDSTSVPYVKRIIGLPNEKVEIINGKVYINDSDIPLDDHFIREEARGDYGPFFVPVENYFVLGDNRNVSFDSKNWSNTFVPKNNILGKVFIEYYPTPKLLD